MARHGTATQASSRRREAGQSPEAQRPDYQDVAEQEERRRGKRVGGDAPGICSR